MVWTTDFDVGAMEGVVATGVGERARRADAVR